MLTNVQRGRFKGGKSFLEIDQRVSGGTIERYDTYSCGHCGSIEIMNGLRTRAREVCFRCNWIICDKCHALGECNFYEESLELALAHPGQGPFLARLPDGSVPEHVKKLRDSHRIVGIGTNFGPTEVSDVGDNK